MLFIIISFSEKLRLKGLSNLPETKTHGVQSKSNLGLPDSKIQQKQTNKHFSGALFKLYHMVLYT